MPSFEEIHSRDVSGKTYAQQSPGVLQEAQHCKSRLLPHHFLDSHFNMSSIFKKGNPEMNTRFLHPLPWKHQLQSRGIETQFTPLEQIPSCKNSRMIRSGRSHTMDPTLNPPGVFSPRKPAPTLLARHEFIRSYSSLVTNTDSQRDHLRRLRICRRKLGTVTREKKGIGSIHHSTLPMTSTFRDSICQGNEKSPCSHIDRI